MIILHICPCRALSTDTIEIRTLRRGTDTVRSSNTNSFSHPHILVLDSGTFLLSPVGSCVRFTSEKQGVGLGWDNVLIAVRVWLNFRIPTVAFSGVDVSPAQCVRYTWVFGRFGVDLSDTHMSTAYLYSTELQYNSIQSACRQLASRY